MSSLTDESVRRAVEEVLSRPEFQPRDDLLASLLQRWLAWLEQAGLGVPPWVTWVLTAVLALVLVRVVTRRLAARSPAPPPARRAPACVVEVTQGAALTFREAMSQAREALGREDARQALWVVHRLLLLRLDEQDAIRFGQAKTNGDYLRECPKGHPSRAVLEELTDLYERVVYGHREASKETVGSLLEAVDRL